MTFEFGPFELDVPGRVVTCARREVQLQPRVFDLLVYLLESRGRVVSKDELLDAIWPNVTVTDNSLQRAVSGLRAMLRQGGLESAIRNLPGKGYRLFVDLGPAPSRQVAATNGRVISGALGAARLAASRQEWKRSAELFESADAENAIGEGGQLDCWALALQCAGKPAAAIPVLVRAVAAHSAAANCREAAADALALAGLYLERGDDAPGNGWLARAEDWASKLQDPATTGLLLWTKSKMAAFAGNPEQALALAEKAYVATRDKGALRVEALTLAFRGFYRLSLGDTAGGFADQDHAATLALSSNVDPITGGTLYCNILWASRMFGDWARAEQWTLGYQRFCTDTHMELSGSCQLHRSEVLGVRGSLEEALLRIQDAVTRIVDDAPWALGDAHRILGDVHAAIGNEAAAFEAYDKAYALGWCPEPGHAMLLLETGDAEAAYASLERSLIGRTWWTLQRHGILLAHLALVAAHTGRHEKAAALIQDLTGSSDRWPMPSIRALTNEANAVLALAHEDRDLAARYLHLARQLWSSVDSRANVARLRLQIAGLQLSSTDMRGAMTEIRAARLLAEELRSHKLQDACDALHDRILLAEGSRAIVSRQPAWHAG